MDKTYLKLSAPFPREAYSADWSRGSKNAMTSVNANFVIERLNQALGVNNWEFSEDFTPLKQGVLCKGILTINSVIAIQSQSNPEIKITPIRRVESIGYCDWNTKKQKWENGNKVPGQFDLVPKLIGDVYKSASTDSLGKAASKIGVASSVFKGQLPMIDKEIDMVALMSDYKSWVFKVQSMQENLNEEEVQSLWKEIVEMDYSELKRFVSEFINK